MVQGLHPGLVRGLEETHPSAALDGHVVARGHIVDSVEVEHLTDHHQPTEDLLEEPHSGVLLTGQRPSVGTEIGTRVLQQQPLDHQHLAAADDPCAAVGPQL